MRYTRAAAFSGLRQALEFHDLLTGGDPWSQAIRQRLAVLQGRPLTRLELWTINKLIEAVIGRVLGLNPDENMAMNQEEACRMIEVNNRDKGRLSA
jgi:hypothetical protein